MVTKQLNRNNISLIIYRVGAYDSAPFIHAPEVNSFSQFPTFDCGHEDDSGNKNNGPFPADWIVLEDIIIDHRGIELCKGLCELLRNMDHQQLKDKP